MPCSRHASIMVLSARSASRRMRIFCSVVYLCLSLSGSFLVAQTNFSSAQFALDYSCPPLKFKYVDVRPERPRYLNRGARGINSNYLYVSACPAVCESVRLVSYENYQMGNNRCWRRLRSKEGQLFKSAWIELVAVVKRDAVKAEDFARRHGVPSWSNDADTLLKDPQIDAICIATPPNFTSIMLFKR